MKYGIAVWFRSLKDFQGHFLNINDSDRVFLSSSKVKMYVGRRDHTVNSLLLNY